MWFRTFKPQHVHHANRRHNSTIEFRPLVGTSSHQHATMASSIDGQLVLGGVLLLNQVLSRALEVGQAVLQFVQPASVGPPLAILAAAAHVGDCHDAEVLDEEGVHGAEIGGEADAEAAVAVEEAGRGGVGHKVFPHRDEHWDLCTVLAWIEYLLYFVIGIVESMYLNRTRIPLL